MTTSNTGPSNCKLDSFKCDKFTREKRTFNDLVIVKYRPHGWWEWMVVIKKRKETTWEKDFSRKWTLAGVMWHASGFAERDIGEEPSDPIAMSNFIAAMIDALCHASTMDVELAAVDENKPQDAENDPGTEDDTDADQDGLDRYDATTTSNKAIARKES